MIGWGGLSMSSRLARPCRPAMYMIGVPQNLTEVDGWRIDL